MKFWDFARKLQLEIERVLYHFNDLFAEARMYQNKHGRFTAPDPLLASASAANPQTFNRYIYTGNNPVNITDPSGLKWCRAGGIGNGVDDIQWFKDGVCSGEWKDLNLDIAYSCNIGPCTIGGTNYAQGTVFRFSSDAQYRAALADPGPRTAPQGQAAARGQSVQQGSTVVSGTTAADAAASGSGVGESGITQLPTAASTGPPLLSLCPTGTSCKPPSGTFSTERLDISKNEPLKSVEDIARLFELCSLGPGIGSACAVGAAATRFGQGRFGEAGDNLLNIVPFLGIARRADKAVDTAKAADDVVEGIYEFVSSNGKVYVGQSSNIPARIKQHLASGKLLPEALDTVTSRTVIGGKTAREIAEQLRIRDLGGIKNLRNERNPIGRARKYLLEGL